MKNGRVIGGHNAPPNTWQWQVSFQQDTYNEGYYHHICGGTIISGFHVMTAAHCILGHHSTYRVVVGEYNLFEREGSEQYIAVERITIHPSWNGELGLGNDIAIIKLAEPIYSNGFVAIGNLPAPYQMLPDKFVCHLTGWGVMDYASTAIVPDILQEVAIPVVAHSVCSQYDWWGSIALENMICAGGDGVISGCQGDSGGPLSCLVDGVWRIHGVVSYGPAGRCNQYKKPTVFTRVSYFLDWIDSVMQS